jgi:hypothetical protein
MFTQYVMALPTRRGYFPEKGEFMKEKSSASLAGAIVINLIGFAVVNTMGLWEEVWQD